MLTPALDPWSLLDKALRERKQAVVVLADPLAGEGATIHSANEPFRQLVGASGKLEGRALSDLRHFAEVPSEWSTFITALRRQAPIQLELRLLVGGRQRWFQFRLTFDEDEADARRAVLMGRDTTRARRAQSQEEESQRLLAAVFLHVSVPVLIVAATGAILMANPAARQFLDYPGDGLLGVNVSGLAPPEFQAAAAAARAKQLQDGGRYELRFDTLTRTGSRVPVRLLSVLVGDLHEQRLRIVTLIPETAARDATPGDSYSTPGGAVGQVMAVSLAALKQACGEAWPRIQARAMMIAEGIIKRRLASADVVSRGDGECFVIWFQSGDAVRNETTLTGIVREIRLRVLAEHGGDLTIQAAAIPLGPDEQVPPGLATPSAASSAGSRPAGAAAPATPAAGNPPASSPTAPGPVIDRVGPLLQELRATKADCRAVTDREGRSKPAWLVDYAAPLRPRLAAVAAALPEEHPHVGEIELIRYGLALDELAVRPGRDTLLVRLSWHSLADVDIRRRMDDRLTRLDAETRSRLVVIVSRLPHQLTANRWNDIVGPLRRQVADVAPMLAVTHGRSPPSDIPGSDWPLSLLMIDGTVPNALPPDEFFQLIETARRRDIAVLVLSSKADQLDWRELGATMFVTDG